MTKDELDDELIKSMKKLVEEETNVAKAFIDTQDGYQMKMMS